MWLASARLTGARGVDVVSGRTARTCLGAGALASLAVYHLGQLVRGADQGLRGAVDFVEVLGLQLLLGRRERVLDRLAGSLVERRAVVLERLFGGIDQIVELVVRFGQQPALMVVGRMLLELRSPSV